MNAEKSFATNGAPSHDGEASVFDLLALSLETDEPIRVKSDDQVVNHLTNGVDLVRQRIGYHNEREFDLTQEASDERLAAERLKVALRSLKDRLTSLL